MKTRTTLLITLALSALGAGCVGTGPNTQQGAVTGGVLGAAAGAIIGHNSRHGDALGGALIGGAAGAVAGGTIGNSIDHRQGTIYRSEIEATSDYYVDSPPPAPEIGGEVVVVRPGPEVVWVAGYWSFGPPRNYRWVPGRWMAPPRGCRGFVPPHWQRRSRGYVYIQGYWR